MHIHIRGFTEGLKSERSLGTTLALRFILLPSPVKLRKTYSRVIDTLQKLSHDSDQDVAIGAIFSMGLVGAGTNNARLHGERGLVRFARL